VQSPAEGTWRGDPSHFRRPSRREFLYVGLVGGLGLTLPEFLKLEAQGAQKSYESKEGVAKAVIHIFLPGGMSAQESFDPKPYAPIEYRGPLGSIGTAIEGIRFSEKFAETAKIADRIAVIRSLSHGEAAHERGVHNMFTGYRPSPAVSYPSFGSIVSHELGVRKSLPPYVCIPGQPNAFAGSGYLSSAYGPFSLGSDPAAGDFSVRDLSLPEGVTPERFDRRKKMLNVVDDHFRTLESADSLDAMDSFYQRAYSLISSEEARVAFDIGAEPNEMRDAYGRNEAGQRMLMARRLVESGVRFVSLSYGGWDHHGDIRGAISGAVPNLDKAYAQLIIDLEQRGMLASTLVMLTTEFGRTPKINKDGGRDHWPRVFSVVLAGGGIRSGIVHGASDSTGSGPDRDAVSVEDFATTIYDRIGIVADKELMAPGDRPIEIVKGGQVINELLA
jgi:hypothetical protein